LPAARKKSPVKLETGRNHTTTKLASPRELKPIDQRRQWRPAESNQPHSSNNLSYEEPVISAGELAESLADLARLVGDTPIDATVEGEAILDDKTEEALMTWYDKYGTAFEDLVRAAISVNPSESDAYALKDIFNAVSSGNIGTPNRVSTALCCDILAKISERLKHFQHIGDLRTELLRSVYRNEPDELSDLRSLLRSTPYFEVVRSLKRKVDKLLKERKRYDRAKAGAQDRRIMRKNVLMRTSKNWQMMLLNGAFRQWRETAKNTVRQREMLAKYFRRLKKISFKDIFVAWKTLTVNAKLETTLGLRNEKQQELQELERALQLAKKQEGDLMMDMVRMETETKQLRARLGNIKKKIAAQKVDETRAIIVSVGKSLKAMGEVALSNVDTMLGEIEFSPDPVKFTEMYFIEETEQASSLEDAHLEHEARLDRAINSKKGRRSRSNTVTKEEPDDKGKNETEDKEGEQKIAETKEEEEKRAKEEAARRLRTEEALKGLPKLKADRLLLRWLKWQLRQTKRGKHPFRRRTDNFKDDLRDGIAYGLLLNKLSQKQNRSKLEKEIDPQRRCDVVMAQAARLKPPATGFITTGHILGGDSCLNAAFVGRLYNTHNQLERGFQEGFRTQLHEMTMQWESCNEFLDRIIDLEKWQMLRASTSDAGLEEMLTNVHECVEKMVKLAEEVEIVHADGLKTSQVWWQTHHTVNALVWEIFTFKVTQEEGEMDLIDLRKARQLQLYTKISDFARFKSVVLRGCGKSAVIPLDKELQNEVLVIEKMLLDNFGDLKRIFEHYAAGADGGHSERMSLNEFWDLVKDCAFTKSQGTDHSAIKKELFNTMYLKASDHKAKSNVSVDEIEILPDAFVETLLEISFRKFRKEQSLSKRFSTLLSRYLLPKACRTNTESFRAEISQDDIQAVFKKHSSHLRKVFSYYAAQTAKAEKKAGNKTIGEEAGMNLDAWIRLLRDTKVVTRPGDMRHDFPDESARKVFVNVQMGGDDDAEASSSGSADDSMIFLEFLEAVAATACFKIVNPYTPLATRLETFLKELFLDPALKVIKQRKK
jgi:hypothetical protein